MQSDSQRKFHREWCGACHSSKLTFHEDKKSTYSCPGGTRLSPRSPGSPQAEDELQDELQDGRGGQRSDLLVRVYEVLVTEAEDWRRPRAGPALAACAQHSTALGRALGPADLDLDRAAVEPEIEPVAEGHLGDVGDHRTLGVAGDRKAAL